MNNDKQGNYPIHGNGNEFMKKRLILIYRKVVRAI